LGSEAQIICQKNELDRMKTPLTFDKNKYPKPEPGRRVFVPIELANAYEAAHGLKVIGTLPGFFPAALVVIPVHEEASSYAGYVVADRAKEGFAAKRAVGAESIPDEVWSDGDDVLDEPD
jgi:hypothetical protein